MNPALQTHILELLPGLVDQMKTRDPFLGRMGAERYYQNNGTLELTDMVFKRLGHFSSWLTGRELERFQYEMYDLVKAWLNATGTVLMTPTSGTIFRDIKTGEYSVWNNGQWEKR